MIVWRGFGWLVPVIVLASMVGAQFAVDGFYHPQYYATHSWPKYLGFCIASFFVGFAGYHLNYRSRKIVTYESGEKAKWPSHTFFFIPVEFWSLVIPLISFTTVYSLHADLEKDIEYLGMPQAGDMYVVDVSKLFDKYDDEYKFGVLIVKSAAGDSVAASPSNVFYNKRSGPGRDIDTGKTKETGYFDNKRVLLDKVRLKTLRENEAILSVHREI